MLLFISIIFSSIYLYFIIEDIKKNKRFNFFLVISIMFFFVYAIIPLIFSFSWYVFKHSFQLSGKSVDIANNEWKLILYYIIALVGYILFVVAYKTKFFKKKTIEKTEQINNENKVVDKKNQNLILRIVSWVCLLLGIVCFILWTNAYGGIWSTIKNANAIRSQYINVVNNLSYFKRPTTLLIIAFFSFLTIVIRSLKEKKFKILDIVGLLLSLLMSLLYLLANDGRLTIILFIIAVIFIVFNFVKIKPIKFVIFTSIVSVILMLIITNLDSITYFIRHGEWIKRNNNMLERLLSEFVFLPKGAETAIKKSLDGKFEVYILNDFVNALFAWVPTKIKPVNLSDVWIINTVNIFGDVGIHGTWPCDLITQCLYDFGFVGVLILPFLLGKIIRFIDNYFTKPTLFNIIVKAWLVMILVRIIPYFSMRDVALSLFSLVIFILIYLAVNKIIKKLYHDK